MIQYLTQSQLNYKKYDACVTAAFNSRIYAYSWYLNIACDAWDALVLDDYVAVMPLPKRKKYGINYVYLPPWTQQLGVFSKNKIDQALILEFIKTIPRKYKLVELFLNSENTLELKKIKKRLNFILHLNTGFTELERHFSKGRKSDIKQAKKHELLFKNNCETVKIVELFAINKGLNIHKNDYQKLTLLLERAHVEKMAINLGVYNSSNTLIAGALFLKDQSRITYLFSAINQEGRQKKAMSLLIASIIKDYENSGLILDFEGSMIKEIALFIKGFGAKAETYFHLKKFRL